MQYTIVTQQENYFRIDSGQCIVIGFGPKNSLYYDSYTVIGFGIEDSLSVTTISVFFEGVRLAHRTDVLDILDILKPDDETIVFDAEKADAHSPSFQICTVTGLSHPLHGIHKTHSAHKIHKTHKTHEIHCINNQSRTIGNDTLSATVARHCCRVVVYLTSRGPP